MEGRGDRDRFEIEEETIKEAAERREDGAVAHVYLGNLLVDELGLINPRLIFGSILELKR